MRLNSGDEKIRRGALSDIIAMVERGAFYDSTLATVIKLLDHEDAAIRSDALLLIRKLAHRGWCDINDLPRIREMLKDDDGYVRLNAGHAIIEVVEKYGFVNDSHRGAVCDLGCTNKVQRQQATGIIGWLAKFDIYCILYHPKVIGVLDLEQIKSISYMALNEIVDKGVANGTCLDMIIGTLYNENAKIVFNSLDFLYELAENELFNPKCLPRVIDLLDDRNRFVRRRSLYTITKLADKGICDRNCLDKAIEIINVGGEGFDVALMLIGNLANHGVYDERCLPKVTELFNSTDGRAWTFAWYSLILLADKGICDRNCLDKAIDNLNDSWSCDMAAWLIAELACNDICDERSMPGLVKMLHYADSSARLSACCALSQLAEVGVHDVSCFQSVIKLLDDEDSSVRREANGLINYYQVVLGGYGSKRPY